MADRLDSEVLRGLIPDSQTLMIVELLSRLKNLCILCVFFVFFVKLYNCIIPLYSLCILWTPTKYSVDQFH